MPDLTRFDFHVNRFMNSYSVDLMDACEVGQYLLLLCKSWQVGKDCCLPDDAAYLARHARVQTVSPRVLEKFPLVETETGTMRRNEPLYEEWLRALERSDAGREKAEKRWGKTEGAENPARRNNAVLMLQHKSGNAQDDAQPVPTQPVPTRTNPIQSGNTTGEGVLSGGQAKPQTLGCWKNIAVRHKRIFGTQASVGQKDKYAEFCHTYGEDVVLACFEDWAQDAKEWARDNAIKQPLFAFWKKLPDMAEVQKDIAEADQQEAQAVAAQETIRQQEAQATEALVRQQMTDHAKFMEYEAPKPSEVDPSEYIKD